MTEKERYKVVEALEKVRSKDLTALDIKKLKGSKNIFRVRIGRARIIFIIEDGCNYIKQVGFRDDNTY